MDRFVTVVSDLQDTDAAAMAALAETIDPEAGPQIRLTLVRKTEKDILCVVVNHMICDGAGLKEYLYLLASLHNQLYAQPDYIPVLTAGPRSALTVLKRLSPREKLQTLLPVMTFPGSVYSRFIGCRAAKTVLFSHGSFCRRKSSLP